MAYIVRKSRQFYLAESKRTPRGPRQTCRYIGSGPLNCRTLAALKAHLTQRYQVAVTERKSAMARCRQIVESEAEDKFEADFAGIGARPPAGANGPPYA